MPLRSSYPALVRILAIRARPLAVGSGIVRVLRRLHAYDLAARFQRNAEQLLRVMVPPPAAPAEQQGKEEEREGSGKEGAGMASPLTSPAQAAGSNAGAAEAAAVGAVPPGDVIKALREASGQLAELADLLLLPVGSSAVTGSDGGAPNANSSTGFDGTPDVGGWRDCLLGVQPLLAFATAFFPGLHFVCAEFGHSA